MGTSIQCEPLGITARFTRAAEIGEITIVVSDLCARAHAQMWHARMRACVHMSVRLRPFTDLLAEGKILHENNINAESQCTVSKIQQSLHANMSDRLIPPIVCWAGKLTCRCRIRRVPLRCTAIILGTGGLLLEGSIL